MKLAVLFLSIFIAVCKADWQDGNDGVDRMNGDLPNMPISLKTGSAPKDCAQLCYSSSQCKAWSYCKPNCNGSTAPQCYLKASVTQQSANPCRVWKFNSKSNLKIGNTILGLTGLVATLNAYSTP